MLCVLLESPHRGDSNQYTLYTIFNIKQKITLSYAKSAAMGFFSKGLKNKFTTDLVNESSVFEPLKFYCIHFHAKLSQRISKVHWSIMVYVSLQPFKIKKIRIN